MMLIGVILALLAERLLGRVPGWGRACVLPGLLRLGPWLWARPAFWGHPGWLLLWWALPVVAVHRLMAEIPGPVAQTLVAAGLLLLCLGPRDVAEDVAALQAARERGDQAAAERLARALSVALPPPEPGRRDLLGSLFLLSHERLFGVLIGFFLFGPAGAVAYRLASQLPPAVLSTLGEVPLARAAGWWHGLMAFVPLRLTALLYGLAGSLDDALSAWRRLPPAALGDWQAGWRLLAEVATASVMREEAGGAYSVPARLEDVLDELLRMQRRALMILLAVFAAATLQGLR